MKSQPVLMIAATFAITSFVTLTTAASKPYEQPTPFESTVFEKLYHSADSFAQEEETAQAAHPNLRQTVVAQCDSTYTPSTDAAIAANYYFWSIEGAPFNKSVYTPYVTNILTGLRLTYYFEYSTECTQQVQNLLSQIYFTVKNGTCNDPQWDIQKMVYYGSQVMSTEFANSFYNCYLFSSSVESVAAARFAKFSDFTDLYTSFLFNLLSQSLSLRNLAVSIQTNQAAGAYAEMAGNIAKLLRIIIDFTSSNAASLDTQEAKDNLKTAKSIFSSLEKHKSTFLDKAIMAVTKGEIKFDLRETLHNLVRATAANPWTQLTFKISDIFNIPLGVIEGSMAAISTNKANLFCSKNSTAARKNIDAFQNLLLSGQVKDSMTEFYRFLQKTDDLVINCGDAVFNAEFPILFSTTAVGSTNSYFGETFVQNILYNIGFQFTDILDLLFVDPNNTEPFWYYVFFRVGDFLIRFIYRETDEV